MDAIQQISAVAEREYALETALDKMHAEWETVVFDLAEYKSSGTYILRAPDDVLALIEDHMVKVATMRGSPSTLLLLLPLLLAAAASAAPSPPPPPSGSVLTAARAGRGPFARVEG